MSYMHLAKKRKCVGVCWLLLGWLFQAVLVNARADEDTSTPVGVPEEVLVLDDLCSLLRTTIVSRATLQFLGHCAPILSRTSAAQNVR